MSDNKDVDYSYPSNFEQIVDNLVYEVQHAMKTKILNKKDKWGICWQKVSLEKILSILMDHVLKLIESARANKPFNKLIFEDVADVCNLSAMAADRVKIGQIYGESKDDLQRQRND